MNAELHWIAMAVVVFGCGAVLIPLAALRPHTAGALWLRVRRPLLVLWGVVLGMVLGAQWAELHRDDALSRQVDAELMTELVPLSATAWPMTLLLVLSSLIAYLWFGAQVAAALTSTEATGSDERG